MKIRCKECYRVLNNNEEYCTRCGTRSMEIVKILETGEIPEDDTGTMKLNIVFYLVFGFLLNGILYVLFGLIFEKLYPNIYFGELGEELPEQLVYFAIPNALWITGLLLLIIIIALNFKNIKSDFMVVGKREVTITGFIGLGVLLTLALLSNYTDISIIPTYYKEFIKNPTEEMRAGFGSISYFKVFFSLIAFAIVQEYIFRKAIINGLDEAFLWSNTTVIIVQTVLSVVLEFLCFTAFSRFTWIQLLLLIIASSILHAFLGYSYYLNKRTILCNVVFRIILIIVTITIMIIS